MNGWRQIVAEPELGERRRAAAERLRARRHRADGFTTPLPDLPEGEVWVHDDDGELVLWGIPSEGRLRLGDIAPGCRTAADIWQALAGLAAERGWTGQVIFSTFTGDGVLADLPEITGASRIATKMQRRTAGVSVPALRVRPMTEAEYAAYREASTAAYAHELLASGAAEDAQAAQVEAAETNARVLPQGMQTPGQRFWTVLTPDDREAGLLWVHFQEQQAYIYDIEMRPEMRGHGYGTRALRFASVQARELGIEVLALNVFGHNDAARRLYMREDFVETEVVWSAALPA